MRIPDVTTKALEKAMYVGWLQRPYNAGAKSPSHVLKDMMAAPIITPEGTISATEAIIAAYIAKAMRGNTAAADKLLGLLDAQWRPTQEAPQAQQVHLTASVALQPAINMILQQAGYDTAKNVDVIEHQPSDSGLLEQRDRLQAQLGI
jgi:hypothetical protein